MVREGDTSFRSPSWLSSGGTPSCFWPGFLPPSCRELALQSVGMGLGQPTHLRSEAPGLEHEGFCALRAWDTRTHTSLEQRHTGQICLVRGLGL